MALLGDTLVAGQASSSILVLVLLVVVDLSISTCVDESCVVLNFFLLFRIGFFGGCSSPITNVRDVSEVDETIASLVVYAREAGRG